MKNENTNMVIVEIEGVKIEVDMRTAKRVQTFRVGDTVKILKKQWSDTFKPFIGTIIDFDGFKNRPTITIAYLDEAEIKFEYINKDSKDVELVPYNLDEARLEKTTIISKLNQKIVEAEENLRKANVTKEIFLKRFGLLFNLQELEDQEKAA